MTRPYTPSETRKKRASSERLRAVASEPGSEPRSVEPALPLPRNAFFGRARERELLAQEMEDSDTFVALVGPPGHGKTRLALELARTERRDGQNVLFLDLTEVLGAEDLLLRLADAAEVGLEEGARDDASWTEVGRGLRQLGLGLVVLDNFEHLVEVARGHIEALLDGLGDARLLITSRERLGLACERRIELGALPIPAVDEDIEDNPAIALFVDRAGASGSTELAVVVEIVRRLEGNALAIELCAMRASVIGAEALLEELERGIDVISGRRIPDGARFRSLACALDHSWRLASEAERAALARFSVFRGGFDLDAARALWPDREESIFDILEALRDRSLLRAVTDETGGAGRHALYESVREFAATHRAEEPIDVEKLHATYYLGEPETIDGLVDNTLDGAAHARRLADSGNLLSIYRDAMRAAPPRIDDAIQALLRLRPLYLARGPYVELARMIEETLAAAPEASSTNTVLALVTLSEVEARRGRFEKSVEVLERARRIPAASEPTISAYVHMLLGSRLAYVYRQSEALEAFAHAGALIEELGSAPPRRGLSKTPPARPAEPDRAPTPKRARRARTCAASATHLQLRARFDQELATLMMLLDTPEAERKLEQALFFFREQKNERGQAQVLGYLSACRLSRCALDAAEVAAEESIALSESLGDRRWIAMASAVIGCAARERGDFDRAEREYRSALASFRALDNRWLEAVMHLLLGELAIDLDDLPEARRSFERALHLERPRGDRLTIAWALAALAALAARDDEVDEALAQLDEAQRIADRLGVASLIRVVHLRRVELTIAHARRTAATGDTDGARALLGGVELPDSERRGEPYAIRSTARLIARQLERAKGSLLPSLAVGENAEWFEVGSSGRVSMKGRRVLRALLARLVAERRASPGRWLSTEALFEAGWPGERATPCSAANRVYVSLTRLRKLGLADLLERGPSGLRLRPDAPLEHASRPPVALPDSRRTA